MGSAGGCAIKSLSQRYLKVVSGTGGGLAAGLARGVLSVLALPYGLAVSLRNALYDRGILPTYHAGVPTICVGNISCGGTGKTPTVIALVRLLQERGLRPTILTRGYKGSPSTPADEVLLYSQVLPDVPVVVGADRVGTARRAVREYRPDVLVMDDGFGHRRLTRDLDIVLLAEPPEKIRLLPRGLYREPQSSLSRADIVISTSGREEENQLRAVREPSGLLTGEGTADLSWLQGRKVLAFCGIGNPDSFRQTLKHAGVQVVQVKYYSDHYRFCRTDMNELAGLAASANCGLAVTTVKDWVRIEHDKLSWPAAKDCPLAALEIRMRFSEQLQKLLNEKLDGLFS